MGSAGVVGAAGIIGSAGVAGASGVVGSAGVTGSTVVVGSAAVSLSAGIVGSAGIIVGIANVGCAGCVGCIGCVDCVGLRRLHRLRRPEGRRRQDRRASDDPPRDPEHARRGLRERGVLRGFLGFDVAMDEPGFVMFASPSNRTAQITVADTNNPAWTAGSRGAGLVEVEDVDALHARPSAAASTSSTR